jgi:hypothetical protein
MVSEILISAALFFLPPLISNPYISIPDRWAPGQLRLILIISSQVRLILILNSQLRTILNSQLRVILNSNSQVRMIFIISALLQMILNKALLRAIRIRIGLLQMILNKGFSTGFPQVFHRPDHYQNTITRIFKNFGAFLEKPVTHGEFPQTTL